MIYGQYCPMAMAVELIGDRWTLLIIRDLLLGTHRFNDLARGLPGISRGLLAERLRRLERHGIVERRVGDEARRPEYRLTPAGLELETLVTELTTWGARWCFGAPRIEDQDPILLLWWMRDGVRHERLPADRVVIRFDLEPPVRERYWLVMERPESSVCIQDPGYDTDIIVRAALATLFEWWLGRREYGELVATDQIALEASPMLVRSFPRWFALSEAAPIVRAEGRD